MLRSFFNDEIEGGLTLHLLEYLRYSVECLNRVLDRGSDTMHTLRPFLIDEISILLGCLYHIGCLQQVSFFFDSQS